MTDTLRIAEVRVSDVVRHSPTIVIGATVRMAVQFAAVTGDTVSRPVSLRIGTPSVSRALAMYGEANRW